MKTRMGVCENIRRAFELIAFVGSEVDSDTLQLVGVLSLYKLLRLKPGAGCTGVGCKTAFDLLSVRLLLIIWLVRISPETGRRVQAMPPLLLIGCNRHD